MLLMNSESKANRSVIYQMFLRPFTEEGTLSAAAEMLNHVRSLGVDVVYLCPVFYQDDEALPEHWSDRQNKSGLGNPQNPYRIKDYFHVDPEYGSDDDLRAFTEKAHTLGLRVMLDLVYYHCGPTAVFLEKHPDFVKQDENGNIRYGLWHFPELNFENPKLREYLWENMEFFVREYGVDGYRCDVGDSVPLSFWEEGRKRLEALRPDIIMLNEGTNPEYLNAFDVNYDFRWAGMVPSVCAGDASAADLQTYWQEIHDKLPESGLVLRSIDNHDIANDCGSLRIEDRLGSAAVEACLTLNFAMDGVPFLYNGYEIADNGTHSIYGNRFYGKNYLIRWSRALTAAGQRRLEVIRGLTSLRHANPALCEGTTKWLPTFGDGVVAFRRQSAEQTIIAAINLRQEPVSLSLPLPINYSRPASLWEKDAAFRVAGERLQVDLNSWGYLLAEV